MWYEYRCQACGLIHETQTFAKLGQILSGERCACSKTWTLERIVSVPQVQPQHVPYFNHSVGKWVSSDTEFRAALKEKSIENSLLTGVDHDFQPVYPSDMRADDGKALGARPDQSTDESIEKRHNKIASLK